MQRPQGRSRLSVRFSLSSGRAIRVSVPGPAPHEPESRPLLGAIPAHCFMSLARSCGRLPRTVGTGIISDLLRQYLPFYEPLARQITSAKGTKRNPRRSYCLHMRSCHSYSSVGPTCSLCPSTARVPISWGCPREHCVSQRTAPDASVILPENLRPSARACMWAPSPIPAAHYGHRWAGAYQASAGCPDQAET
jgi:hypothetical protein